MAGYFLSRDADEDLQNIFNYTQGSWGEAQATTYMHELFARFDLIARTPAIGRVRPELGEDIRSFPYGQHVVFFTVWQGEIAILRVLHGSRDVDAIFENFKSAKDL